MNIIPNIVKAKLHLCASGSILLPLAQKWGLVGVAAVAALSAFGAQTVSAASITLSTPTTLSVDVTPSAGGTFAKSIKPGSITVSSDAYAGYTLKIQDNDGESALTGKSGKLPSIPNEITENDFNSNTRYNNMWGYKPSVFSGSKNENFLPSPKQAGDVIDKTDPSSNDSVTKDYTVELGVRVDNNQPAGTYTGTFIFTVTANDLKYSITYDGNGAKDIPDDQSGFAPEGEVFIIGDAPTLEGYYFAGWCNEKTTDETCTGKIYQPKDEYKLANKDNVVTLYAMWTKTTMQNWTGCGELVEHETIALVDSRDDNVYKVRKLKDGQCWMVDNLRLGDSKLLNRTLTLANSDVAQDFELPISKKEGFNKYDTAYVYVVEKDDGVEKREFGGYYSWYAATAGTGTHSLSEDGANAPNSICPKGWRMPSYNIDNEINRLYQAYNRSGHLLEDADGPNFLLAGRFYDGAPYIQSEFGSYWSSSASGDVATARVMSVDKSNSAYSSDVLNKMRGDSMRCVARN